MAHSTRYGVLIVSTVRLYDHAGIGPHGPAKPITPAYVALWVPKGERPWTLTLLESRLWRFTTHYHQRRTRACLGAGLLCEGCAAQLAGRPTAYLAAVVCETRQRVVWQVSAGALAGCPQIETHDGRLVGHSVIVRRRHAAPTAPVDAEWVALSSGAITPAPVDTLTVLARTWGYLPSLVASLALDKWPTALDNAPARSDNLAQ